MKLKDSDWRKLTGMELNKQARFAGSQALNKAAYDGRRGVQKMLYRKLDIRKRFLPNSVVYNKSTKDRLIVQLGFLERAKLVPLLEEGGRRRPATSKTIAVPQGAKGRTGKVAPSKRPKRLLQKKGAFIATINGTTGIWERLKGRKLRLLYVFKGTTQYEAKTMTFFDTAEKVMLGSFKKNFPTYFDRALRKSKHWR